MNNQKIVKKDVIKAVETALFEMTFNSIVEPYIPTNNRGILKLGILQGYVMSFFAVLLLIKL